MDHDLLRAYMQQRRELGTPRFHREIEAMIGRCASVRAAYRPRQGKDLAGSGSDRL
jgi:putative transposase